MPDVPVDSSSTFDDPQQEPVAAAPQGETTEGAHQEPSPSSDPSAPQGETAPESDSGKTNDRAKGQPSAAEKRIKQLLAENKQLKQRQQERPAVVEQRLEAPRKPQQSEFSSYEAFESAKDAYTEKYAEYIGKKAVQDDRILQERARTQAEQTRVETETRKSWEKRSAATLTRHPTFDISEAIDAVQANPATDGFIVDSEIGPDLLQYLNAHPEEATELREMSPYQSVRHMTRLEAKLLDHIKGTPARPLPRPPRTVDGKFAPSTRPKTVGEVLYGAD